MEARDRKPKRDEAEVEMEEEDEKWSPTFRRGLRLELREFNQSVQSKWPRPSGAVVYTGLHLRILARGAYCEIYNLMGGKLCA